MPVCAPSRGGSCDEASARTPRAGCRAAAESAAGAQRRAPTRGSAGRRDRRCKARRREAAASACRRYRRRSARAAVSRRRPARIGRRSTGRDCRASAPPAHPSRRRLAATLRRRLRTARATGRRRSTRRTGRPARRAPRRRARDPRTAREMRRRAPGASARDEGRRRAAPAASQSADGRSLRRHFLGALDDDVLARHVLVEAGGSRGHALDLVDDVLPLDDFAEYAVAPAVATRRLEIEEVVVGDVDEELRRRRMRIGRARHRDRVAVVLEAVRRFVRDRRARALLREPGLHAPTLDHEVLDHAVEQRVVVVSVAYVLEEVLDGLRRVGGIELDADVAVIRMQDDHSGRSYFAASTTTALVITTGSVGTSRGSSGVPGGTGLPPPFATFAILLTTSMPSTTLPNTV